MFVLSLKLIDRDEWPIVKLSKNRLCDELVLVVKTDDK